MCGICGIIGPNADNRPVKAMIGALRHRGPDACGRHTSPSGKACIGHARLAIIDPESGQQPMGNEDGMVWVTFNGCIYNYLELRQFLRQRGHVFKTYCDTEVIVHAYEQFGTACVDKFIGMFAFAVWDERRECLFCARDRLGIKPFYYARVDDRFLFASEIKGLLASGLVTARPHLSALRDYLTFQASLTEDTFFEGVHSLAPGHTLTVGADGRNISHNTYWNVSYAPNEIASEEAFVDQLRRLLEDSVKIMLRSDVPIGTHLSGGLDSSVVTCLSQAFNSGGGRLMSFHGAFDEGPGYDESRYARITAEAAGADMVEIRPTPDDFLDHFARIIHAMDEPCGGPGVFPQYLVSREASRHVKVVLGGQGGDEIFVGYARYIIGYLEECLHGAINKTANTARFAATLASIIPSLPILQQYIPMLQSFWAEGLFDAQEKRYFRLMDRSGDCRELYLPEFSGNREDQAAAFEAVFFGAGATSFVNRMTYFDLKVHLPALLQVEDRTSMAWGLESRVPLLDHRIVEFMASIPPVIKFKNGQPKYLFREAIKNIVPKAVYQREDKMGFPVPLQQWYAKPLREFVADVLLDSRAKQRGIYNHTVLKRLITQEKRFGRAIWGALCLEMWFRTFIDRGSTT